MNKKQLAKIIDDLGALRAQIALLKEREETLVAELKALGPGAYDGTLFDACIYAQSRTTVDWRGVIKEAKVPQKLVDRYATTAEAICLKVSARRAA